MKRILLVMAAVSALLATACVKPAVEEEHSLSVTPSTLLFEAEGGTEYLEIRTDAGSWALELSAGAEWCVPGKTSGATSSTFAVTAGENIGSSERTATITVSAPGCVPVEVAVRQEASMSGIDFEGEAIVPSPAAWDGTKRAAVSYQALVYSFADSDDADRVGDFKGLVSRLDYLDELGVSAIWLSPIHPSASYHGYDVKDYAAVNPAFGSEADLQELIDQAHRHGIKVYLDYVLNHSSKDHPWFLDAVSSEDPDSGSPPVQAPERPEGSPSPSTGPTSRHPR